MSPRSCLACGEMHGTSYLQCEDCRNGRRGRKPANSTTAGVSGLASSNSASVGGVRQVKGPVEVTFNVAPMGKPRQTQRDKWKKRPVVVRYRQYCDDLRAEAERAGFTMPESGAALLFNLPMPKSWSKKKKREHDGQPHQQKPDLDNMVKALADALCPDDDSHIWNLTAEKRWARTGSVVVKVQAAEEMAA